MHPPANTSQAGAELIEGVGSRPIPRFDELLRLIEGKHGDMLDLRLNEDEWRAFPVAELRLDLGLHHNFEPADIRCGKPLSLDVRTKYACSGNIDGEDGTLPQGCCHANRQVFDDRPIYVRPTVDFAGREDARQGAGSRYGICHPGRPEPRKSPHDLHSGVKINSIDQDPALEIVERHIADQTGNQGFEWFAAVQGRGKQSTKGYIGSGDLEHIAAPNQTGSGFHLAGGHPGCPRGGNERSDAGSDHEIRHQTSLFKSLEHADVGEPFEATTAENQCKRAIRYHRLALLKVALRCDLETKMQESCAPRGEIHYDKAVFAATAVWVTQITDQDA